MSNGPCGGIAPGDLIVVTIEEFSGYGDETHWDPDPNVEVTEVFPGFFQLRVRGCYAPIRSGDIVNAQIFYGAYFSSSIAPYHQTIPGSGGYSWEFRFLLGSSFLERSLALAITVTNGNDTGGAGSSVHCTAAGS